MCQTEAHLEQTLPCMAQKSGFMSGSELATSGYSAFSALQAVSSVAQQLTIICSAAPFSAGCREYQDHPTAHLVATRDGLIWLPWC